MGGPTPLAMIMAVGGLVGRVASAYDFLPRARARTRGIKTVDGGPGKCDLTSV